jgi:hypothetical protein
MGPVASATDLQEIIPLIAAAGVATLRVRKAVRNVFAKISLEFHVWVRVGEAKFSIENKVSSAAVPSTPMSVPSMPAARRTSGSRDHRKIRLHYQVAIKLGGTLAQLSSRSDCNRCSAQRSSPAAGSSGASGTRKQRGRHT